MSGSSFRLAAKLRKLSNRRKRIDVADRDEFRRVLLDTIDEADVEGRPDLRAKARHLLADLAADSGDRVESLRLVDEALNLVPGGNKELRVALLTTKAGVLDAEGRFDEVIEVCRQGIEIVERGRYLHTAPYLLSSVLRPSAKLYRLGVWAAVATGGFEVAHGWTQLARARGLVMVDPQSGSFMGPEAQRLRATAGTLRDDDPSPDPLSPRRRLLDSLFETLKCDPPPAVVSVKRVQESLAEGQRVLSYFSVDRRRLVVTAYAADRTERELVELDDAQLDQLEALRMAARGIGPSRGRIGAAGRALEPVLFPDRIDGILEGCSRLSVALHGKLHGIPYSVMTHRGRLVIDRFAVALLPTLASVPKAAAPCRPDVVALGVDHYDVPTDPGLHRLHRAIPESEAVVAHYQREGVPAHLLDPSISRAELLDTLQATGPAPSSLHLAVHGEQVIEDDPLRSYLLLERSRFDGIDISTCNLRGTTVVLSACNAGQRMSSGRGLEELPGDDLLGLQASFFFAGARQIVAGQWLVKDEVAEPITLAFHRRLLNEPADLALQGAINQFRRDARPVLRSPQFWGSFFLVANGLPGQRGGGCHVTA